MRLVVNKVPLEVGSFPPHMTLLRYLRESCRLTGTKEGCASGDCGACTVILVHQSPQGPVQRTVNSCICPLGSLENQDVITVEGLGAGAELHPVQEAMHRCHGSQCGFCTPGFVMSLAALHNRRDALIKVDKAEQRRAILDAISGNLCRCTGYRPIIEAGFESLKKPVQMANIVQSASQSAPLVHGKVKSDTGSQLGYCRPASEAELQNLLRVEPGARLIAGGTDLMLEVTQLYNSFEALIDLNAIDSLRQVRLAGDRVSIGAAATYTEIEQHPSLQVPELMELLHRLGSRQIRNRGTLGGNIGNASPIADTPPYLMVLDAELVIRDSAGSSRREKLTDFYLAYKKTTLGEGEYIACIEFAHSALEDPIKLLKLSKRYEDDISAVMGAYRWRSDDTLAIAYGGLAATSRRAWQTEALLNQSRWQRGDSVDESVLDAACAQLRREFTPMTDVRASAEYRSEMAGQLLRKACRSLVAQREGRAPDPGVFSHA